MFGWDRKVYSQAWNQMDRLLQEMNEVLGSSRSSQKSGEFPPINMYSNEEGLMLRAILPGINPEKLEIKVLQDTLFLQGEREKIKKEGITFHRQERKLGLFKRVFQLPFKLEQDKVEAKYERGILEIKLPRSEEEKPKKIKINVS